MAAVAPAASGGVGAWIANIALLALAWGIGWGLADLAVYTIGGYDSVAIGANAAGGAVAGALAGAILSVLYWGVFMGTIGRLLFLVVFWVAAEVVMLLAWEELGISSYEDFLAVNAVFGVLLGVIFAITLQARKPGLWFVKVPLAAVVTGFATFVGRTAQFELFDF